MGETRKAMVLIIDDSKPMREIAADMLRLLNLEVLTAVSGREGITLFQNNPVDLVLLDMNMQEMDGAAAYRALRDINPHVQAIVCTSESKSKAALRFGDREMPPYLHKPFDTTIFLDTVTAILQNNP